MGEKGLNSALAPEITHISEEDIINCYQANLDNKEPLVITADDIAVRRYSINMGMKNSNPLEKVCFYRQEKPNEIIKKQPAEIS